MNQSVKQQLDKYLYEFDAIKFIREDPISFPWLYSRVCTGKIRLENGGSMRTYSGWDHVGNFYDLRNVEIMAFIAAMIAWGNRKTIVKDIAKVHKRMGSLQPYEWIAEGKYKEIRDDECIHRTIKGKGFKACMDNLRRIYREYPSVDAYLYSIGCTEVKTALIILGGVVFRGANMGSNHKSSFKRLNMAFRWLVRDNHCDLGVWNRFKKKDLYIPLDTHVAAQARKLGITSRWSMDWKTVEEITAVLREFDPNDPVKYDLALFQMGINKRRKNITLKSQVNELNERLSPKIS